MDWRLYSRKEKESVITPNLLARAASERIGRED
jgi:hypothetical protein